MDQTPNIGPGVTVLDFTGITVIGLVGGGPPGPPGPQGPTGPVGPQGSPGPGGVAGVETQYCQVGVFDVGATVGPITALSGTVSGQAGNPLWLDADDRFVLDFEGFVMNDSVGIVDVTFAFLVDGTQFCAILVTVPINPGPGTVQYYYKCQFVLYRTGAFGVMCSGEFFCDNSATSGDNPIVATGTPIQAIGRLSTIYAAGTATAPFELQVSKSSAAGGCTVDVSGARLVHYFIP